MSEEEKQEQVENDTPPATPSLPEYEPSPMQFMVPPEPPVMQGLPEIVRKYS